MTISLTLTEKDAVELVRLMAIYLPYKRHRLQMFGDLERSKPSDRNAALRDFFHALRMAAGPVEDPETPLTARIHGVVQEHGGIFSDLANGADIADFEAALAEAVTGAAAL